MVVCWHRQIIVMGESRRCSILPRLSNQIALFRSRNWQSVFCLFYTSMLYNSGNEKKHKQQQLNPFFFLFSFFPRSFNRHLLLKGSETWTNKNQLLTHPYHDSVFSAEQCKYPFRAPIHLFPHLLNLPTHPNGPNRIFGFDVPLATCHSKILTFVPQIKFIILPQTSAQSKPW